MPECLQKINCFSGDKTNLSRLIVDTCSFMKLGELFPGVITVDQTVPALFTEVPIL